MIGDASEFKERDYSCYCERSEMQRMFDEGPLYAED